MTREVSSAPLSRALKPVCPREDHEMQYEEHGIAGQSMSSYHCGYFGCSVRYNPQEGYFTVVETPNFPSFVEEPGVNTLQCPRHHTWMCRVREGEGFMWRCGVDGCDQTQDYVGGTWLRQPEP